MDTRPGGELVKLHINGPGGPCWIVLGQETPLDLLKQILQTKTQELREVTISSSGNDRLMPLEEKGEIQKLVNWVNEREATLASVSPDQLKRLQELNEKKAEATRRKSEKELETIRQEELEGKRVIVYASKDSVLSVDEASSKEQLELVQKYLGHKLDDGQGRKVDQWISEAPDKSSKDLAEKVILKLPDKDEFQILSPKSAPDFLGLALATRTDDLTEAQRVQIQDWISKAPKADQDKIRIFHAGEKYPGQSSEISLSLHSKPYFEELNKQISAGAYLLPEHKERLDRHCADLAAGKLKEPEFLEIPSGLPGQFTILPKGTDKEVLQVIIETRKELLPPELQSKLQSWVNEAPEVNKKGDLRLYNVDNPKEYKSLSATMTAEEIDQEINNLGFVLSYMRKEDAEKLFLISADQKTSSPSLGEEQITASHESGISIIVDSEMLEKKPDRIKELLNDSSWNLNKEDRAKLQLTLNPIEQPQIEDEFQFLGEKYSKDTNLQKLKELSHKIMEDEHNEFSPEHAKKLLTWIARKEKYGEPAPTPNSAYVADRAQQEESLRQRTQHLGRLQSLLNDMASQQSQTVDGYYSEIWGADKAPLAAGPMGATSGGLRPMGIWQFTEVLQAAMREKLYAKQLGDMNKTVNEALLLKSRKEPAPVLPSLQFRELGGGSGISSQENQIHKLGKEKLDLAISQMYASIRQFKSKDMDRKPNRDNKDIEENLLPGPGAHRGPGGFGGMGM